MNYLAMRPTVMKTIATIAFLFLFTCDLIADQCPSPPVTEVFQYWGRTENIIVAQVTGIGAVSSSSAPVETTVTSVLRGKQLGKSFHFECLNCFAKPTDRVWMPSGMEGLRPYKGQSLAIFIDQLSSEPVIAFDIKAHPEVLKTINRLVELEHARSTGPDQLIRSISDPSSDVRKLSLEMLKQNWFAKDPSIRLRILETMEHILRDSKNSLRQEALQNVQQYLYRSSPEDENLDYRILAIKFALLTDSCEDLRTDALNDLFGIFLDSASHPDIQKIHLQNKQALVQQIRSDAASRKDPSYRIQAEKFIKLLDRIQK
jgi:hypothetical protein